MAGNQKIDTYLSRISHVSQFVLVAFAIFGYFYTVRPIYQKEQLSEDIAKKEVELGLLRKDLDKSTLLLSQHSGKEENLKVSISKLETEFESSKAELLLVRSEVKRSREELNKQRTLANRAVSINRRDSKDLYFENFSGLALSYFINKRVAIINADVSKGRLTDFDSFKRLFATPYDAIHYAIDKKDFNSIEAVKNVPSKLKDEVVASISKQAEKDKLELYPSGMEDVFNKYLNEINALSADNNIDGQLKLLDLNIKLYDYVVAQNTKNMMFTKNYLHEISVGFK